MIEGVSILLNLFASGEVATVEPPAVTDAMWGKHAAFVEAHKALEGEEGRKARQPVRMPRIADSWRTVAILDHADEFDGKTREWRVAVRLGDTGAIREVDGWVNVKVYTTQKPQVATSYGLSHNRHRFARNGAVFKMLRTRPALFLKAEEVIKKAR